MTAFGEACALVEAALAGRFRRQAVSELTASPDLGHALARLREGLGAHVLAAGGRKVSLDGFVADFDRRTRADGFHVLHDWDGKADRVNPDTIPVDVLDYLIAMGGGGPPDSAVVAILLDYYLFNILCAVSADSGTPAALTTISAARPAARAPSELRRRGHRFASHAGTLILIATAHFEPEERGYRRLLEKVMTLAGPPRGDCPRPRGTIGCHCDSGMKRPMGRTRSSCATTTPRTTRGWRSLSPR